MYTPPQFEQPNIEVMQELMSQYPLASLITLNANGIEANHVPLHLSVEEGERGILRGHIARANPVWNDFSSDAEVLAIFHGPDAYISPSWYATKPESGKVVPTWNYAVVHAYGVLRIVDDAAWVRIQLEALTQQHEANLPHPWAVSDAPEEFTEKLTGMVVGIEMAITRLSGKWKVSQNQPLENQYSVIDGLKENNQPTMAALVKAGIIE